ncbi:MAG: helix-turn-helix domain-containing protein [Lachnospiraceae bacterium]|nr:helix-turn-helix domain-containing protein [Lachnospiraceae bacterium]
MISNQTLIGCIEEAKKISGLDFMLTDNLAVTIASTADFSEVKKSNITEFVKSDEDNKEINNVLLLRVTAEDAEDYALLIKGDDSKLLAGKLLVSQIQNLIIAYKDKIDKDGFFQNLLLDNLLLVDIYNKAQKLNIEAVASRCVLVIELSAIKDPGAIEMVKELFDIENGDFVTTVDEDHIIVVKNIENGNSYDEIEADARMLVDMFRSETMTNVRVAFGTIVNDIKGVSKSYKEANMALDVGKIFYAEKFVISYSTLGIGRLIYQLPINLCEMYIDEVFGGELSEEIDEEILNTINKFLDNSLNVSETSRQLYIHRNTLVYRIEKLEKATGMDVRNFDDALSFRIAMMVLGYINYVKNNQ